MVTWMGYAVAVASLTAIGALSLEKLCEQTGLPRRFGWLAGLSLALLVPLTASPPAPGGSDTLGPAAGTVPPGVQHRPPAASPVPATIVEPVHTADARVAANSAGRAALALWGLASVAALLLICAVPAAAALARRSWERRRIAGEDVYVSRRFGPALVGVARPAIVIPRWVVRLGDAIAATVVTHEREHARARDHLALLHAGIVVALMPWNPAVWWMFLRLRTAVEIDCDHRVLASGVHPAEYGDLLLGIGSGRPARPFSALAMASSGSMLERRLKAMRNQGSRVCNSTLVLLGCLALGAVAAACGMSAPTAIVPAVNSVLEEAAPAADESPEDVNARVVRTRRETGGLRDTPLSGEGGVLIRGVNRLPSVQLTARSAARDPLVVVDGVPLAGGLETLLAAEPLDIGTAGYFGHPPRRLVEEFGGAAHRGIVFINTQRSPSREGRQP